MCGILFSLFINPVSYTKTVKIAKQAQSSDRLPSSFKNILQVRRGLRPRPPLPSGSNYFKRPMIFFYVRAKQIYCFLLSATISDIPDICYVVFQITRMPFFKNQKNIFWVLCFRQSLYQIQIFFIGHTNDQNGIHWHHSNKSFRVSSFRPTLRQIQTQFIDAPSGQNHCCSHHNNNSRRVLCRQIHYDTSIQFVYEASQTATMFFYSHHIWYFEFSVSRQRSDRFRHLLCGIPIGQKAM